MSRASRGALSAIAALATAAVLAVPSASAQDVVLPFTNYLVGGTLTVEKLHQSITLPAGSTFNGTANLTTNRLQGDVFVPEFGSTIRVLGVPTQLTTKLEQAQPVQGTIALEGPITLDYEGPLAFPLAFDGETTIPRLTGCGLLGPTLGTLLSGPGNAYHLTLSPPPGA